MKKAVASLALTALLLAPLAGVVLTATSWAASNAGQTLTQGEYERQVEQAIRKGIDQILADPGFPKWQLRPLTVAVLMAVRDGVAPPDLNQLILDYRDSYPVDPMEKPKDGADGNAPQDLLLELYLKPKYRQLLSPEAQRAIEEMCWKWVYRHSNLADKSDFRNPTRNVWILLGSENHDANERPNTLLALQVLRHAPQPYGPDAKLYGGFTVAEHYKAWVAWYKEMIRQRAREGCVGEMAAPGTYGRATVTQYFLVEDLTDDPELKAQARKFLDLYWTTVALDYEPRTGLRGIAATRCKGSEAYETPSFWAESLLHAWGWTERPSMPNVISSMLFCFDYRPPLIVTAMARDLNRKPYHFAQRVFGRALRPEVTHGIHVSLYPEEGEAMNSYRRRDVWYTPDYLMSSHSYAFDRDFLAMVSQAGIVGVTFSHGYNDRLVVFAGPLPLTPGRPTETSYGINSLLKPDCLVVGRDPRAALRKQYAKPGETGSTRLLLSKGTLLDNRVDAGGWTFSRSGDGYVAFRVAGNKGTKVSPSPFKTGTYFDFNDIWAPVVVQTGQAKHYESFEVFMKAVQAQPFTYAEGKLTYTSLAGDVIEYWSKSTKIPQVNGKEFNLNPENTYDSPYLTMKHCTDKAVISYPGHKELVLDFAPHKQSPERTNSTKP
jgi:hypothetical protein